MKRTRTKAFGIQQQGTRKVRVGNNRPNYNPANTRIQTKMYVDRTPGGQIVSDSHYFDTYYTAAAVQVSTTTWAGGETDGSVSGLGAISGLFSPKQGDTITDRTGRKAFLKTLRIRGTLIVPVQQAQTVVDLTPKVRVAVYMDKQTNGAQSQAEQVFDMAIGADPLNYYQYVANIGRFQVLKDKTFVLGIPYAVNDAAGATIAQGGVKRDFKLNIKVNKWVNFNNGNAGTIADIVDNSFHMVALTDGAATAPTIAYQCRAVFLP